MSARRGPSQVERTDVAWRRRLLIFGESIRSDFGNPLASSWRVLMVALSRAGHEVVFIEPRRSASLTALLRHRGSQALRRFAECFPELQYRTLELPRGRELDVWLARELALVDAVIVLANASPEVLDLIADYDEPRLIRIQQLSSEPLGGSAKLPVVAEPVSNQSRRTAEGHLYLGPAIDTTSMPSPTSSPKGPQRIAVLAWDAEETDLAAAVRQTAMSSGGQVRCFSLGTLTGAEWEPITELDLPTALEGIELAVVVSNTARYGSQSGVRSLLPWSLGIPSITVQPGNADPFGEWPGRQVSVERLGAAIQHATDTDWPDLSRWDADRQVATLIDVIDRLRSQYRRLPT